MHERGGACVVTADHGNADHMLEPDGSPNTAHSLNPVPLIVTVRRRCRCASDGGILADVAPTVLELLGSSSRRDDGHALAALDCTGAMQAAAGRGAGAMSVGRTALAGGVLHRRGREPLRDAARLRADRAAPPEADSATRVVQVERRGRDRRRPGGAAAAHAPAGRALADRAARGGVPGEPLHGARRPSASSRIPRWALYARLPLQPLMMWWAWRATRR